MTNKNQKEVTGNWKTFDPVVSICCITYNHEEYIRDTMDGFLMQETSFPFEILIHDDASTDNTKQIIKEYETKYPNLIRPIYQTENQKSKIGKGMNPKFNFPRAKGAYIALCEGDDYWTDRLKLEKQVTFLDSHKEFSSCFHAAEIIYDGKTERDIYRPRPLPDNGVCKNKYLVVVGGSYIPTASVVYRAEMFRELPDWVTGDYALNIYAAKEGKIGYIDEVMSVYRRHTGGVWTAKNKFQQFKSKIESTVSLIPFVPQFKIFFVKRLNKLFGNALCNAVVEWDLVFIKTIFAEWSKFEDLKMGKTFYYFLDSLSKKVKGKIAFQMK